MTSDQPQLPSPASSSAKRNKRTARIRTLHEEYSRAHFAHFRKVFALVRERAQKVAARTLARDQVKHRSRLDLVERAFVPRMATAIFRRRWETAHVSRWLAELGLEPELISEIEYEVDCRYYRFEKENPNVVALRPKRKRVI